MVTPITISIFLLSTLFHCFYYCSVNAGIRDWCHANWTFWARIVGGSCWNPLPLGCLVVMDRNCQCNDGYRTVSAWRTEEGSCIPPWNGTCTLFLPIIFLLSHITVGTSGSVWFLLSENVLARDELSFPDSWWVIKWMKQGRKKMLTTAMLNLPKLSHPTLQPGVWGEDPNTGDLLRTVTTVYI